MARVVPFFALFAASAALGFARSWPGMLVDSRCYAAEERNVNPTDTLTYVDRDGAAEIRYCAPRAKTKSFAVVQSDGRTLRLDSAGNAKASELVRSSTKRRLYYVDVNGERSGDEIKVESISSAADR
jgi:hypothetical protein